MASVLWLAGAGGLVRMTWERFSGDLIVRNGWFS